MPVLTVDSYFCHGLDKLKENGVVDFLIEHFGETFEQKKNFCLAIQKFLNVVQTDIDFMGMATIEVELGRQDCLSVSGQRRIYIGVVSVTVMLTGVAPTHEKKFDTST